MRSAYSILLLVAISCVSATAQDANTFSYDDARTTVGTNCTSQCDNVSNSKTICTDCPITCSIVYSSGYSDNSTGGGAGGMFNPVGTTTNAMTSFVDNVFANHHHFSVDYQAGRPSGGCSTCGGSSSSGYNLMNLYLERRHRYRDISHGGSFGPGVFLNLDIRLDVYRDNNTNVIDLFDPTDLWPSRFVDGANGDTKDGIFYDQRNQSFKDLRLYNGQGNLVTDVNDSTSAILTSYHGVKTYFDIVDVGGKASTPVADVSPWRKADVGRVARLGDTTYSAGVFTVKASGRDIWNQQDEFHYAFQSLRGDGSITARVTSLVDTDQWAKASVMIRESLADGSRFALMAITPSNGAAFQRRTATYAEAQHTGASASPAPYWVRLTRSGNTITGFGSTDGTNWTQIGSENISFGTDVFVGLALSSHRDGTVTTATFDNVSIVGTPTPTNEWPAEGLPKTMAGRVTKVEDRNGYALSLTYKTFTTQELTDSPSRQLQINSVTDSHGRIASFTYNSTQQSGLWVISRIDLPNSQNLQYQYTDGKLSGVQHPDSTQSTFTYGFDSTAQCTTVAYDDAGADGTHRRKTAFLTNNIFISNIGEETAEVVNQSSLMIRMIASGNNEVTYLNTTNPHHVSSNENLIYEGAGKIRLLHACWESPYYKDGWQITNPAAGFDGISGTKEDSYANTPVDHDAMHRGTWSSLTDVHGVTCTYTYDADTFVSQKTYPDTTTEAWQYNAFKLITRYKDRLNRVTKYTYDTHGNMLTKEVGILFTGGQDVNQAEYALYQWEYYPANDAQQFLLKTEFDADYDPNNSDMHRTDYTYNAQHFLITKIEGADVHNGQRAQLTYTYDGAGRMATSSDAIGRTTTYGYDSRDRVEKLTYSDGSTERFIYGTGADANLLVKQKDRNGNVTKFEYDNSGRRIKTITAYSKMDQNDNETVITDPLVRVEEICTYLDGTNLKKTCLRSGDLTEYTFDYRQRVKSTTVHPRNNVSLTSTNTFVNNLLFKIEDPYGRKAYNSYRSSDSALVRSVRGTMPSFSLADFAAMTALSRDLSNNATYIIDDMELDAAQQTVARVDGRNIRHTMSYDTRGRLTQKIEAESVGGNATTVQAKTQFEYDANSNRTRIKNPRTFTENSNFYTEFTYNGRNLTASQTEAAGKPESATLSYTYFLDKRLADTTDGRNFVWSQTYKECCGRLATKADPVLGDNKQPVTYFGYDFFGNTTHTARLKDVAGVPDCCTGNLDTAQILNETTTKFDARNRPIAQTVWLDPIGQIDENDPPIFGDAGAPAGKTGLTTRWRYDDNLTDNVGIDADYSAQLTGLNLGSNNDGMAVEVTNPSGEKSVTIYDGLARTIRTIDGNLNKVTISYDDIVSNLVETVVMDGLTHPTKSRTDGADRVRETEDAETRVTTHEFDANSNRVKFRDPNSTGMDYLFDERNREKQATDTATTPSVTKMEYDADSNIVKTTDALTKDTVCSFDARNRKISCTDRINGVTSYEYDKNSNMTKITDADANAGNTGKCTIYEYDPRNLLATEKLPDHVPNSVNDSRTYTYDGANRLVTRLDQNSDSTTYAYDMANRLLTRGYPDNQNDTFTYDPASRLISAANARYSNTISRNYSSGGEKAGRLKSETQTIGGNNYTVAYDYDEANRQTSVKYPSNVAVTRVFTNRNQLQQVWLNNVSVAQRTYDNGMRLSTTTYGNSLVENRTYFSDNLSNTIKIQNVTDFTYSWDANKRKTTEADGIVPPVNSQQFGYNDENRLVSFSRQDGYSQSWNLTKVGDWNSFTDNGNQQTRTHNEVHKLTAIGQAALSYDVKGNLIANCNGQSYVWDFENRMKKATIPANPNPVTADYAYDAFGRRVSKTFNSVTTVFINDGFQEIAEYENGTLAREFVYGSYIDEPLMMIAGSTKTYYHSNNLHSASALTDSTGAVVERYTYAPYGKATILAPDGTTVRTVSAVGNPWTDKSRRLDVESGLMYYRARMYSVDLGRFIVRDPLEAIENRIGAGSYSVIVSAFAHAIGRNLRLIYNSDATVHPLRMTLDVEYAEEKSSGRYSSRLNLYQYVESRPTSASDPYGLDLHECGPAVQDCNVLVNTFKELADAQKDCMGRIVRETTRTGVTVYDCYECRRGILCGAGKCTCRLNPTGRIRGSRYDCLCMQEVACLFNPGGAS